VLCLDFARTSGDRAASHVLEQALLRFPFAALPGETLPLLATCFAPATLRGMCRNRAVPHVVRALVAAVAAQPVGAPAPWCSYRAALLGVVGTLADDGDANDVAEHIRVVDALIGTALHR
jgi:hypothetical protein